MDRIFKTNLRIGIRSLMTNIMILLVTAAGCLVFIPIISGAKDLYKMTDYFIGMSLLIIMATATTFFTGIQTAYAKKSIEMGSTRQSFFIAAQVLKIIATFLFLGAFFVISGFVALTWGVESTQLFQTSLLPMLLILFVFLCTFGEFIGAMINLNSKFTMVYIIFMAVFGGIFGANASSIGFDSLRIIMSVLRFRVFFALIIIGITAIMSGISWSIFRKYTIK